MPDYVCNLGSRSECYGAQIEYEKRAEKDGEAEPDSDQNQNAMIEDREEGTRIEGDISSDNIMWVRWGVCTLVLDLQPRE